MGSPNCTQFKTLLYHPSQWIQDVTDCLVLGIPQILLLLWNRAWQQVKAGAWSLNGSEATLKYRPFKNIFLKTLLRQAYWFLYWNQYLYNELWSSSDPRRCSEFQRRGEEEVMGWTMLMEVEKVCVRPRTDRQSNVKDVLGFFNDDPWSRCILKRL